MKAIYTLALGLGLMSAVLVANSSAEAAQLYKTGARYNRDFQAADGALQTGKYEQAEAQATAQLKSNPNNLQARSTLAFSQAELYKLDAAEKNADAVLAKNPKSAIAHLVKGVVYRNRTASLDMTYRGNRDSLLQQSASELEQALSIDSNAPEIHNQLGVTYRFMGRNSDAMTEFQKALALDPHYSEALLNQGIMHMVSGDTNGAKQEFQQAIHQNSKNYMAHYRLGEAYLQAGDAHAALQSLNTALSLNRGNAAIMSKMGDAYQAQGNTAAAIASYRKATMSNPSFMPPYMAISDIYDNRGDGELAMSELRSALNINPHYDAGRDRLGRLALTVDKPDQALQYYKEALKDNPNDPEAINGISQALTVVAQKQANWSQTVGADSDLVNAEQSIDEALRMNPNDLRLHLARLRISQLDGKPAMSEAELNNLANMTPHSDSEAMIQGEAFLTLGRYQESDQVFNNLIQHASNNPDKLLVIGDTLKINGSLDESRKAYQAVLAADPNNMKAQRGLVRVAAQKEESDKTLRVGKAINSWWRKDNQKSAIDFYEDALSKDPRQPDARLKLAKLYEENKMYDRAAQSYQFYLGLAPNLTDSERQHYQNKIAHLQQLAAEKAGTSASNGSTPSANVGGFLQNNPISNWFGSHGSNTANATPPASANPTTQQK